MKIARILFFLLIVYSFATAQNKEEVANVGNYKITKDELVQRFELTPQMGHTLKGKEDEMLKDLLHTIIAEKLWAIEAEKFGYDTTTAMKYTFRALEKMHVRDALWKLEVGSKVNITDSLRSVAFERGMKRLNLQFIFSESKDEIFSIYKKLQGGTDFYTILAKRPEVERQVKPYQIEYGQMEEPTEDMLYALEPNEFTVPVKAPMGWFIFKLLSEEPVVLANDKQARNFKKKIRDVVEQRATDKVYQKFHEKFFNDVEVKTNGHIFWSISNLIIEELKKNKIEQNLEEGKQNDLTADNMYRIEDALGQDTLFMVFIDLQKDPITVKQFLREFIFEGFFVKQIDEEMIRAKLNSRIKRFIEMELLAREGYKRGLQNLPEVKKDLEMWRANYLMGLLKSKLIKDTFYSEEEAEEYYKERNSTVEMPKSVNIIEILTSDLETVEMILNEIDNGADFKRLAAEYTEREWTKMNGGEFGFFPVTMYGDIGRIAADMEIGEVYGPLKVDEGWSIFKLIDKKKEVVSTDKPFEAVKDELRKKLSLDNYNKTIVEKTVKMANEYGVKINEEVLSDIEVTNMNMLVYRYFGFGGRLLAVPLNKPFTSWFKPWKEGEKYLP